MSMREGTEVGEPDARQVDGSATGKIKWQGQQDSRDVSVGAVVNQHDHGISVVVRVRAHHEHANPATAQHVVADVTSGNGTGAAHHAALNSANAAASSPVSESCQAPAAATARRSRNSRIASATSAERLPPAAAALRSLASSSSSVIEMLMVTSTTLPTTTPMTRSLIRSACRSRGLSHGKGRFLQQTPWSTGVGQGVACQPGMGNPTSRSATSPATRSTVASSSLTAAATTSSIHAATAGM
jgi:hypothetical protein